MTQTLPLDDLFKRLHLANARRIWRDLCVRAEKEQWSYEQLLSVLVAEEVAQRKGTRLQRLSRGARFPYLKTIDDFDFTYQSTLRLSMLGSYLSPDFVTEGRCLILRGETGRGKTHLAIAIAYRAIQNGFDALFTTAAALIDDLSRASREGRMREALVAYTQPDVLVCDEVGYLTYGTDAANVLFHVVNERHLRRRSMIFTTNKHTSRWGSVLHDPDLARAIVDRILERGRIVVLDGPSGRTRHLPHDELDPDEHAVASRGLQAAPADVQGSAVPVLPTGARVSGKPGADFPEPTLLKQQCEQACTLPTVGNISGHAFASEVLLCKESNDELEVKT